MQETKTVWTPRYKIGDVLNWQSKDPAVSYRPIYENLEITQIIVDGKQYRFVDKCTRKSMGDNYGPTIDEEATLAPGDSCEQKSVKSNRLSYWKLMGGGKTQDQKHNRKSIKQKSKSRRIKRKGRRKSRKH